MNLQLDRRTLIIAGIALVVLLAAIFGLTLTRGWQSDAATDDTREEARQERLQAACASNATYDRLKELVFDQAARIRSAESELLDQLSEASIVRMERPVVKSRDEDLNVTVCTGRFILELPPGAENAFDGERRLVSDIEYAAQAAVDGSGLVYQMSGAEPIIYRLATVGLTPAARAPSPQPIPEPQPEPQPAPSQAPPPMARPGSEPAPPPPAEQPAPSAEPRQEPQTRRPEPQPQPKAEPEPERRTSASPSFNCRSARTRSERRVCASNSLAALDRQMSSLFYSALAGADAGTRAELRRSRDRFLAYRERCGTDACIAQAYRDRMDEIRDIAAGR